VNYKPCAFRLEIVRF